jgi:LysM repeat protein
LGESTIGIKVADGSYYPVLEQGYTGTKRLVLTTAKDDQRKVQIDLYRGNGDALTEARYIGSLIIENIRPAAHGVPEIELSIGINAEGELSAEASDKRTGETQSFSTSLTTLPESETYGNAEFMVEPETSDGVDFEEQPLTGESYPSAEERRVGARERRAPNLLLLVLFVILSVALVAAIAYFVYRVVQGPKSQPLSATKTPTVATQPAPAATPAQPAVAPATTPEPAPAPAAQPAKAEVTYRIKSGDTLWDIAATYYRNPWLYPKLAKANAIPNPDLIFAGTRIVIPEN